MHKVTLRNLNMHNFIHTQKCGLQDIALTLPLKKELRQKA